MSAPPPASWVSHRGRWVWLGAAPQRMTVARGPAGDVVLFAVPSLPGPAGAAPAGADARGAPHIAPGEPQAQHRPRQGGSERSRRRRDAQEELLAYYRKAAAEGSGERAGSGGDVGAPTTRRAAASGTAAPGEADASDCDDGGGAECPICLESLSSGQVVRAALCGHALHVPCLASLVQYNSTSCPQCRASLVPPALAHLAPALGGARSRSAGANRAHPAASHALAGGYAPGAEPRPGGSLPAAQWEWGASDDSDADADDAERGHARHHAPDGGALVMALRLRAQHVSVLRAICAKVSLAVFLTLVGLVLFLLIGSFTHPTTRERTH